MLRHALALLIVAVLLAEPAGANGLNLLANPGFERLAGERKALPVRGTNVIANGAFRT